jgi:hypothetical protein
VNERVILVFVSMLMAFIVSVMGLIVFAVAISLPRSFEKILSFSEELLILAVAPTMIAAGLSSALYSRSKWFESRGNLSNAIRIVLLSYPILFVLLMLTIPTWLHFEIFLPLHGRPSGFLGIAEATFSWSAIAFIVGVIPALVAEFFAIRFVRARWSPAARSGVTP